MQIGSSILIMGGWNPARVSSVNRPFPNIGGKLAAGNCTPGLSSPTKALLALIPFGFKHFKAEYSVRLVCGVSSWERLISAVPELTGDML